MYGFFAPGPSGLSELTSFVEQAGAEISNSEWTWAMASKALTASYDPSGNPDEYFLLDGSGHIAYQNSVPVSTLTSLLTHVRTMTNG